MSDKKNAIKTDVLIIGGGAAGLSAAYHLHSRNIIIAETDSSNSALSPWNIMLKPRAILKKEMLIAGGAMNDRKILNVFIRRFDEIIADLKKIGISLKKSNIGAIPNYPCPGTAVKKIIGKQLTAKGVVFMPGKTTSFLSDARGHIRGVKIKTADGKKKTIFFNHLILAGGGLSSFFELTTGEKNANGSLLALCAANNFLLRDLEFFMFHPFLITDKRWPRALISGKILTKMEFENEQGRQFLSAEIANALQKNEYHAVFPAMIEEFYRQSLKSRIFAKINCPTDWFENFKRTNEFGFIFRGRGLKEIGRIEINPAFHFSIGGLRVNEKMATSQPRVYAAGEIVGGLHGANRIGGTGVSEAWLTGKIAAEQINSKRATAKMPANTTDLNEKGFLGLSPQIKKIIWKTLGPIKNDRQLRQFISFLKTKKKLSSEEILLQKIAEISLARQESIGAFIRDDRPIASRAPSSFLLNDKFFFR